MTCSIKIMPTVTPFTCMQYIHFGIPLIATNIWKGRKSFGFWDSFVTLSNSADSPYYA